jgi:FkbM family methyltransferase
VLGDFGSLLGWAQRTRGAIVKLQTAKRDVPAAERLLRAALFLPVYIPVSLLLRGAARLGISIVAPRRTPQGITLRCRLTDMIGWYIWLFGEWEPDLTRFLCSRLRDGDVFVDVGANIGYYSLLASAHVGQRGRVVAVEASAAVFAELRANAAANQMCDRIRLVNKAASASAGTLTVFAGPTHNVGMSTTVPTRGLKAESAVAALPLDQILTAAEIAATRVIKIDVEGAEPDVLAGMANLIPCLRPDAEIVVELSPRWWLQRNLSPADVLKPFIDVGFKVYTMTNDYSPWRYLWLDDVTDAVRQHADLSTRAARLDVVLSRYDSARLPIVTGPEPELAHPGPTSVAG